MSCRLPGNVSTPDEFWELLARSRTGFSEIPPSRFSADRFFHANPGKSGTTNARGGNFLTHDLSVFDAPFFGFTQQEAVSLDPQQRLLLECTFEALESAGIPKHEVVGQNVGVFVGGTFSEYEADLFRDPNTIPMHQATAGVHLNMLPEFWISYSMSRLFGEAGRSFAFDDRGTGYGRGEGCGMVLLKLLDQAIKDNDPIRAVITGSGINQDGKTPGITMPNGSAQGIAGIIKTALMLERGFILPNYDFKRPNEKIPFDEWGLKVATRQQPWPFGKKWASVNGFGFGGTNAHVIMTRGPLDRKTMKEEIETLTSQRLFVLSANDKTSTEKVMKNLGVYLEQRPEVFQNDLLSNLAYTLGQRKSLHPWRIAVSVSTGSELVEALSSGKVIPTKQELEKPRIGWIFTGQADKHLRSIGAAFSLLEELNKEEHTSQVNAAHISQPSCTAVQLALVDLLQSWGIFPLAVAGHSSGEIGAAYSAGIIGFEDAMTVAYHRGRLIPVLKERFPELHGSMIAVGAGKDDIVPFLDQIPSSMGEARIACINSPSSVTVSGDTDALAKLQSLIEEAHPGMFVRKLQVDTAYHSHHMNLVDATYWVNNLTCAVRFDEAVQSMCQASGDSKSGVTLLVELGPHAALQGPIKQILKHIGAPKIGYTSALSRKKNAVATALSMAGVLFVKGIILNMGAINFPTPLERPPQVLTDLPRYAWNHSSNFYYESRHTMIHKHHNVLRNDIIGVLASYSNDFEPTWTNVVRLDDLPWLRHHQMQGVTIFPISGFAVMAIEAMVQMAQSQNEPWDTLEVMGLHVTAPAMLAEEDLEMTITLRSRVEKNCYGKSREFVIRSWSKSKGWTEHCVGVVASARRIDQNEVEGERLKQIRKRDLRSRASNITVSATEQVSTQAVYKKLSEIGVSYGATFQGLHDSRASVDAATALIFPTDTVSEMPHHQETRYILHPTLLEQLISMYWPIISVAGPLDTVHLPSTVGKITVAAKMMEYIETPGASLEGFCEMSDPFSKDRSNRLSMFAIDGEGEQMISVEDLVVSSIIESAADTDLEGPRELCYKTEWEDVSAERKNEVMGLTNGTAPHFDSEIIIVHGDSMLQHALATKLSDHFQRTTGSLPTMGTISSLAATAKEKLCLFIAELERPILADLNASDFDALQTLLTSVAGILWVVRSAYDGSQNPDSNMISGLSRALRSEGTLMKFATLDLDSAKLASYLDIIPTMVGVFSRVFATDGKSSDLEFMERGGRLFTPRIVNDSDMNEYVDSIVNPSSTEPAVFSDLHRPLKGSICIAGSLDSLAFEDDNAFIQHVQDEEVDIHIKAVSICHKDTGLNHAIGMECSGIVIAVGPKVSNISVGDRVAAVSTHGTLSTIARTKASLLFKIPDDVPFESATTVPMAYSTAIYALIDQARLCEGESILIHAAATDVGQAALSIAMMVGADPWVTVETVEEQDLLMREHRIPANRIWHIGSPGISEAVAAETGGKGVDIILDVLANDRATPWTCIANFGRIISVGARNIALGDIEAEKNISLLATDVIALIKHRPHVFQRTLTHVARLLRYGKIQPIAQAKTYSIGDAATALQAVYDQGVKGKAIVVMQDDELVLAPRVHRNNALFREDATYLLIGGTGGLGRSMASWMIDKGAKNLVLLSRSGALKGRAKEQIDTLNEKGGNIVVRRCDVADKNDVETLISIGLDGLPPVRGIIHGAMVLHDVLFEKMTYSQYNSVVESKVKGAWNFYNAAVAANASLDFFIVISSAAGAVGNRGQAAYAAANTFLNGFAQYLLSKGLRAASLDLTAVSDAGYLAEDAEKAAEVARTLGSDTICEAEVLALIQAAVEGKLGSCNGHPITGMRITPTMRPFWSDDAKFMHLLSAAEAASAASATTTISWSAAFRTAASRADAECIVCNALVEKIAEVISMEPEELDTSRALSHYPLDSLTAIEVRNFITRMFEANLQVLELLASGSIESLAKVVSVKSKITLPEA
ncbi:hypothetical protein BU24DRAFT_372104 [Aaosphaeria arxii CBS 175.79]|uniref:Uncharacterized protein n=1 Tax=Aaosphaeria arxii CBS 175.79 TaxID=1450172 RepID=A0A6A5XPK5_9PLEO|nr:uncharacterized protein BU24DRAFT_372104 [Aaosphaeria arxii CBS 175.79]KAF2015178.1 hypothetical protein BU24DRAFT_372104 [Aaosphaeria arxii CBS 175.79]